MTKCMNRAFDDEIAQYLKTGDYDDIRATLWPGRNSYEKIKNQHDKLLSALINEVINRSKRCKKILLPKGFDLIQFTRKKCAPMVNGLFPKKEVNIVMKTLERACVFLTSDSIIPIIQNQRYLCTSWTIANIYLRSIGANTLAEDYSVLGFSEETTLYISMEYFSNIDPFEDWVVHEGAHLFHNTKRRQIGLPYTRYKEWPLDIDFLKRENFAYLCEVYHCIKAQAKNKNERIKLFEKYSKGILPSKEFVNQDEFLDNLKDAVQARNGWKSILNRCRRNIIRTNAEK